jgi:hypothetical protein
MLTLWELRVRIHPAAQFFELAERFRIPCEAPNGCKNCGTTKRRGSGSFLKDYAISVPDEG